MKPEPMPRGVQAANGLVFLEGMLRIMRAAGDTYGHDYEAILIYWSVVVASVGRLLRNEDQQRLIEGGGKPLPEDEHHPISARAIAEATGLPRETVRRKISALVAQGHLAQDSRGVRTIPGLMDQRHNEEFVALAVREVKRMGLAMDHMMQVAEKVAPRSEEPG
jgi:DNA-binding transcriptional regulator YhcF (GntR family)